MKMTKRMELVTLQGFIFHIVMLVILGGIFVFSIFPKISNINEIKQQYLSEMTKISEVQKDGISYEELTNLINTESDSAYLKSAFSNYSQSSYTNLLSSASGSNFQEKFAVIAQEVEDKKNDVGYKSIVDSVSNILPEYADGSISGIKKSEIISYIEELFHIFQIEKQGEINIGDIQAYDIASDIAADESSESLNQLSQNVYYFPLSFQITGAKKNIFQLLHYLENVGKISVNFSGGIDIYQDEVLSSLEGKTNIYANQLLDIKGLTFEEYPDSSTYTQSDGILDLMFGNQASEKYSGEISLSLYILGLPEYSIGETIQSTISEYSTLNQKVNTLVAQFSNINQNAGIREIQGKNDLQNIQRSLKLLATQMEDLNSGYAKKENLQALYKQALEYQRVFMSLEEAISALESNLTNKE